MCFVSEVCGVRRVCGLWSEGRPASARAARRKQGLPSLLFARALPKPRPPPHPLLPRSDVQRRPRRRCRLAPRIRGRGEGWGGGGKGAAGRGRGNNKRRRKHRCETRAGPGRARVGAWGGTHPGVPPSIGGWGGAGKKEGGEARGVERGGSRRVRGSRSQEARADAPSSHPLFGVLCSFQSSFRRAPHQVSPTTLCPHHTRAPTRAPGL